MLVCVFINAFIILMAGMFAAVVAFTAVFATGVTVVMIVMIAFDVWVVRKTSGNKIFHCFVSITADASIQLNARFGKGGLCTSSDTSANKYVCA